MTKEKEQTKEVAKTTGTLSTRFTAMVMREYSTEVGQVKFDEFKKRLAQHLFIKVDMAMAEAEKKRDAGKNKTPITWANVNLEKLAVDAVHRIELQLDALIPNHIHPIPYYNSRNQRYDIDLRIGYAGKDYYHREMALYPPSDIRYELVHANDELIVNMKGINQDVESYEFKINNPFDRGPVVGGFGYIAYDDPKKNKIVLVTMSDFEKSKKGAGTQKFWGPHEEDMQRKTIVHRTVKHIVLDPQKINRSFAVVESSEYDDLPPMIESNHQADQFANQETIDITPEPEKTEPEETVQEPGSEPEDEPKSTGKPGF